MASDVRDHCCGGGSFSFSWCLLLPTANDGVGDDDEEEDKSK